MILRPVGYLAARLAPATLCVLAAGALLGGGRTPPAARGSAGGGITTIAFEYAQGQRGYLFVEASVAGRRRRIMLDTGAPVSALHPGVMRAYLGAKGVRSSGSSELTAVTRLGEYEQKIELDSFAFEFDNIRPDGLLGDNFFEAGGCDRTGLCLGARITLDFRTKRLTVDSRGDRPPFQAAPGAIVLPLKHEGYYFVSLPVNGGRSVDFLLDTGSPVVYLPRRLMREFGGPHRGFSAPLTLAAAGRKIAADAYSNYEKGDDFAYLGLSVLSRFRVTIDYRDKVLYLERPQ